MTGWRLTDNRGDVNHMKVIGITGGVGCGKSTVLKLLEKHTASYLIMADDVAKSLYVPGSDMVKTIGERFGADCVNPDGTVNRQRLAQIIFSDDNKRDELNAIVHPAVNDEIDRIIEEAAQSGGYEYTFLEAALFFEEGYENKCDEVWYVTADADTRRKRLKESRGYSDEKIDSMLKSQMSEDEYKSKSSHVIDNSGTMENTELQLVKLI